MNDVNTIVEQLTQATELARCGRNFMTVELDGPVPDSIATSIRLPCLSCMHDRANLVRNRIGSIYLQLLAGGPVQLLTPDEVMRGCCKHVYPVVRQSIW